MERPSPRTCLLFAMSWWVRLVKWSLQVRVQRWHHDLTTVWKPESCCKVFVLVVLLGLVLIFGVVGANCKPCVRAFGVCGTWVLSVVLAWFTAAAVYVVHVACDLMALRGLQCDRCSFLWPMVGLAPDRRAW